jgi:hypothetical protein
MYVVLEGEFEYEITDKDTMRTRRSGAGVSRREFDVRKLLFFRKKATIDDRRRVLVSEEKRIKMSQDSKICSFNEKFPSSDYASRKGSVFQSEENPL